MANIFVQTFGCSANFAEGEIIKGLLSDSNHNIIQAKEEADVIILNICTVKGNQNALKEIRKTNQDFPETKLIIAGCIPLDIIPKSRKNKFTENKTQSNCWNHSNIKWLR